MGAFDFLKKRPFGHFRSFVAKTKVKRPKPWVLVNPGVFLLSLYGSLTRLPDALGVIALLFLLFSAAVGLFRFLR